MPGFRMPARVLIVVLAIACSTHLPAGDATVGRVDAQGAELQRYSMVDQWPPLGAKKPGELWRPISLDVAPDGTVFISDPDAGGVHRMLPNGEFASMIGKKGSGDGAIEEAGPLAIAPDPDPDRVRLYVIDTASDRIAVYDHEGSVVGEWLNVAGAAAITASADGNVFVADAVGGWVWAYDSTGRVPYAWGESGTGPGQFDRFTDISVLASGEAIAVGDKGGERVQVFDLPPSGVGEPTLRDVYDLTDPAYGDCRADVVNLLHQGSVWVGQGDHACLVNAGGYEERIAPAALNDTICRESVTLPHLRADEEQYFAIAESDPNPGRCGEKGSAVATSRIVVRYDDAEFTTVSQIWPAVAKPDIAGLSLFAPSRITSGGSDLLLVQDEAPYQRYFQADGHLMGSVIKEPIVAGWDVEKYQVHLATATDTVGEVLVYYAFRDSVGHTGTDGYGIARLKESQRFAAGQVTHFIEPVWLHVVTRDSAWYFDEDVPIDLVYNAHTDEAVLLYADRDRRTIEHHTKLRRVSASSGELAAGGNVELPDNLAVSTFVDLSVGSDGRMYALDAFADSVLVMDSKGDHVSDITVANDVFRISGGPDGDVFALRSSGAVEHIDESGSATARFDARPLPDTDPTTLADLLVMDDGRVLVVDGQVGVVSVFAATEDGDAPIPDDETCAVTGDKTAAPTTVVVGQPVTVTLGIEGRCGNGESPTDIMLVATAPGLGEIPDTSDHVALFSALDFTKHRVGMVAHLTDARLEFPLVDDKARFAFEIVAASKSSWPDRRNVAYRMGPAVRIAHENLPAVPGRSRVIMLFRTWNSTGFRNTPAPWPEINAATQDGIRIMAYEYGSQYPADPDDYITKMAVAQRRMVERQEPDHLAVQFELLDSLGETMDLVAGSTRPGGTVTGPNVRWSGLDLLPGRSEFALQVKPQEPGRHATNASAAATFIDGFGKPGRVDFPVPMIDVEAAPPTATATNTARPPPTDEPTRPVHAHTLYVPVAQRGLP